MIMKHRSLKITISTSDFEPKHLNTVEAGLPILQPVSTWRQTVLTRIFMSIKCV